MESETVIHADGTQEWFLYDQSGHRLRHRNGDQPAVIHADGKKEWYQYGKLHRQDGPAVEWYENGKLFREEWFQNNLWHREGDQPAIVDHQHMEWYQHGQRHRDGDQPAIIYASGTRVWYRNGHMQRDHDRPTLVYPSGTMLWYSNDQLHRICGPAAVNADGTMEWWFEGHHITREQLEWIMERQLVRAKRIIKDCLTARIYSPCSQSGRRIMTSAM